MATKLNVLAQAWEYPTASCAPFMKRWAEKATITRPYQGLRLFHNIPLSVETVCKLYCLATAGAEIVVACTDFLIPATKERAIELVQAAGLEYRPGKEIAEGEFDYYLDCCGELSEKPPPRCGVVELTRTGALIYAERHNTVPVLSIDDSQLKALETFYGTGDGFVRAFEQLRGDPTDERFVLIGYGKVGQGVAYKLAERGAQVVILDIDKQAVILAEDRGFEATLADDSARARDCLAKGSVVITATGRCSVLSSTFSNAEQLLAGKVLANIGADDEIGEGFSSSIVLTDRKPINFSLQTPTIMHYLDPSFYAHNLGVQIIQEGKLSPGYHSFPPELDAAIVDEWTSIHGEADAQLCLSRLDR